MSRAELALGGKESGNEVSVSFPAAVEYDGPPQAYFELFGQRRGTYQTFAIQGKERYKREMLEALGATLADMKSRGGKYLFWRRRPMFEFEDGGENPVVLRCRLAVLDEHGEQIPMLLGLKPEGEPAMLYTP